MSIVIWVTYHPDWLVPSSLSLIFTCMSGWTLPGPSDLAFLEGTGLSWSIPDSQRLFRHSSPPCPPYSSVLCCKSLSSRILTALWFSLSSPHAPHCFFSLCLQNWWVIWAGEQGSLQNSEDKDPKRLLSSTHASGDFHPHWLMALVALCCLGLLSFVACSWAWVRVYGCEWKKNRGRGRE